MERENSRTIIPAQPGWYVAWPRKHKNEEDYTGFFLDPIVAWEGDENRELVPLCPEGSPFDVKTDEDWAIKIPDGRFFFLHADVFDSEAKALAYVQSVMKHRRGK
jgi:hypothetical protein